MRQFPCNPVVSASALATALALGGTAWGGPPLAPTVSGGGPDRRSDTRAYVGLAVSFGGGASPQAGIVVGAQAIRVRSSDRLSGVDLNARFNFRGGFDRIALAGLYGNRSVYANLGGGFNPQTGEFFATAAAQGAYLRAGVDWAIATGQLKPYVEVNTLSKPKSVQGGGGVLSCPTGYSLQDATFWEVPEDLIVDGQTCIDDILTGGIE